MVMSKIEYCSEALRVLQALFSAIGWKEELNAALAQERAHATIHGLVDAAYSEWGQADEHIAILCQESGCFPGDIELWDLCERFPSLIFRDGEWGMEYARGRLFSLRDYQQAKEAIANLGEDSFSRSYQLKTGNHVPVNAHLWEEEE
jgi:hypothetical protein